MTKKHIHRLLEKYLDGTETPEERHWLETHYLHLLDQPGGIANQKQINRASVQLRSQIQQQTQVNLSGATRKRVLPIWLRYAAAILVFLSIGGSIYWMYTHQAARGVSTAQQQPDILPGGNRATLTIADGQTVDLRATQRKIITGDELEYADGTAVLERPWNVEKAVTTSLTLRTPKGGTYQVTLPDGTQVWLNAASRLKYPARFAADQRVVELSGEAYFAVTKDADRPFRVISRGQAVEVLGTEFNISVYEDEPVVKSTLVEGSVRVSLAAHSASPIVLRPGQQAVLRGESMSVEQVDVANVTAWKVGRFSFKDKPFQQVMRELARWYNIEVVYEGDIPAVEFYGGAFRNHKLSTVLRLLESAGLQYRIQDRTLVVSTKSANKKGGTR